MTRKVIATEGKEVPGLRTIQTGALTFDDDWLPVTYGFDKLIGRATDFERNEETGEISAEIELFNDFKVLDEEGDFDFCQWTFSATPYTEDVSKNLVLSALIKTVSVVAIPGIPKDMLKKVENGN